VLSEYQKVFRVYFFMNGQSRLSKSFAVFRLGHLFRGVH